MYDAHCYSARVLLFKKIAKMAIDIDLRQYTCPQIIGLDTISLGFLVYIDAVCRL